MVGSGLLTLPYTYYHSGIIGGIIVSFISFAVSVWTCILTMRLSENGDTFEAFGRYWGPFGYYLGLICTLTIVETACTA